eukprot:125215-Amphidinium_carterae.1
MRQGRGDNSQLDKGQQVTPRQFFDTPGGRHRRQRQSTRPSSSLCSLTPLVFKDTPRGRRRLPRARRTTHTWLELNKLINVAATEVKQDMHNVTYATVCADYAD